MASSQHFWSNCICAHPFKNSIIYCFSGIYKETKCIDKNGDYHGLKGKKYLSNN